MDTNLFLNGLRRLISRRGRLKEMRSHIRTHFVSGNRKLQEALLKSCEDKIDKFLQRQEIYRKPNSPKASHMGGVWQRVICSARKIMNAMVHEQVMDDEGLQTLMCEVESILNGRPLTKLSDYPKEANALSSYNLLYRNFSLRKITFREGSNHRCVAKRFSVS